MENESNNINVGGTTTSTNGGYTIAYTSGTSKWKFCPCDGTKLEDGWSYCPKCGTAVGYTGIQYVPVWPSYPYYPTQPQQPYWYGYTGSSSTCINNDLSGLSTTTS